MDNQKKVNKSCDLSKDNHSNEQNSFFKELEVLNTCNIPDRAKEERGLFLDKIRELAPICISELARELKCSRSKLYYVLRDFEFAGLVESKVILDGNKAKRIVVIPDYKKARLE